MSEANIDRLLAAAIHQAIADLVPMRLDFYEGYLRSSAWREDAVNLAPVSAVLSFLRHELEGTYDAVMTLAARYAADWVYDARPWRVRLMGRLTPGRARLRRLVRLGRAHLGQTYRGTRVRVTFAGDEIGVEILGSIFCSSREPTAAPQCRYYLAFFEHLLHRGGFVLAASAFDACRAQGGAVCRYRLVTDARRGSDS